MTRKRDDLSVDALKLVQSRSLSVLIQEEIARMILAGEVAIDEWLNEASLSQRFGVSRGPVREALRSLLGLGLVRQEKNRGVFVRGLTAEEADQIYEIREVLDELIGRKAAALATKDQIKVLRALVTEMDRTAKAGQLNKYYAANLRFHDCLAEYSGNAKLQATYRRLINELHLFRLRSLAQEGALPKSYDEHRAVLKAIETGDCDTAGRLLKAHVMASRRRVHEALAAASVT
jgi:phosphonate utilization transcriptional regulator